MRILQFKPMSFSKQHTRHHNSARSLILLLLNVFGRTGSTAGRICAIEGQLRGYTAAAPRVCDRVSKANKPAVSWRLAPTAHPRTRTTAWSPHTCGRIECIGVIVTDSTAPYHTLNGEAKIATLSPHPPQPPTRRCGDEKRAVVALAQ